MEKTRHVMLAGGGADKFAAAQKLEIVEPSNFYTPRRREQLPNAKKREAIEFEQVWK